VVGAGGQATITLTVPAGYDDLLITIVSKTAASAVYDYLELIFNGDVGANYAHQWMLNDTNAGGSNYQAGQSETSGLLGFSSSDGVAAGYASSYTVSIPGYAGTTFFKIATAHGNFDNGGTYPYHAVAMVQWRSTAPITEITLKESAGSGFAEGTTVTLYGLGGSTTGSGSGSTLSVTDGTTTVDAVTAINLTGASVSGTSPTADVTIDYPSLTTVSQYLSASFTPTPGAWTSAIQVTPAAGTWIFFGTVTVLGNVGDFFTQIAPGVPQAYDGGSAAHHFSSNELATLTMTSEPIGLDGATPVSLWVYPETGMTAPTVEATSATPALAQLTSLRGIRVG
jgi:hypothetical protein